MPKAVAATFANAKRRALRVLGQQTPDSYVPDRIMFFNDELGFIVRLSNLSDDPHIQKMIPWLEVDLTNAPVIETAVSQAVEQLARLQMENPN